MTDSLTFVVPCDTFRSAGVIMYAWIVMQMVDNREIINTVQLDLSMMLACTYTHASRLKCSNTEKFLSQETIWKIFWCP